MKLIKANRLFRKMTKAQQKFVMDKQIEGKKKLKHWLDFFEMPVLMDVYEDKGRMFFTVWAWAGTSLGFFMTAITAPLTFMDPPQINGYGWFIAATALLWSGIISFFVAYNRKRHIANGLRKFLYPLLLALQEDADPGKKVYLYLHVGRLAKKENYAGKGSGQKDTPYGSVKYRDSYYTLPWCAGELPLKDGTILQWAITDTLRKRTQSRRGKSKQKNTIKHEVKLRLLFPKNLYMPSPLADKAQDIEDRGEYYQLKIKDKQRSIYFGDPTLRLNPFLEPIAIAFKQFERKKADA